jgi:hypothetical protein
LYLLDKEKVLAKKLQSIFRQNRQDLTKLFKSLSRNELAAIFDKEKDMEWKPLTDMMAHENNNPILEKMLSATNLIDSNTVGSS